MRKVPVELIKRALEEDGADYDITTLSTVPQEQVAHGSMISRQAGVIAGLAVVIATFHTFDERISIELLVTDGDVVQPDQTLARLHGHVRLLLSSERVALNFLGRLSGIVSLAPHCLP